MRPNCYLLSGLHILFLLLKNAPTAQARPLLSLPRSFQWVPKCLLWRECPPHLPPGRNFGLSLTAAPATSSPPRLLYVLGTVYNFLSPCLCSWYFLQLESCFSSTLPAMAWPKTYPSFRVLTPHSPISLPGAHPPLAPCVHFVGPGPMPGPLVHMAKHGKDAYGSPFLLQSRARMAPWFLSYRMFNSENGKCFLV